MKRNEQEDFAERIIRPKLNHYGLVTGRLNEMKRWYEMVVGMKTVHESDHPLGTEVQLPFKMRACFVTNDEADHRIGMFEIEGMPVDPGDAGHSRYHHLAFEYANLTDLLDSYDRLEQLGIVPLLCADHGSTTSLYYKDPDHNVVELLTNNFGDWRESKEFMRHSPYFERKPIGEFFDPGKILAAKDGGASASEIHERVYFGKEFAPDKAVDPNVIL